MMLLVSTLLALTPTAQAAWTPEYCARSLALARQADVAAEAAFKANRIGVPERDNARLDFLEEEFNCRVLTFNEYCRVAQPVAQEAVQAALAGGTRVAPELLLKCQLRNGRLSEMCRPLPGH